MVSIMKRMVYFLSLIFTCITLPGTVFAAESQITPKDLKTVISQPLAYEMKEPAKSENQKAVFQFIDPEGSPVPYLYIFDARDALDSPYDDYRLPNGIPSKADGTWEMTYSLTDDNGEAATHITFIARNLYDWLKHYEKTYEIPLPLNQDQPIQLLWDKPTPMSSFNSYTHKLTIHIQDEKGNPIPNAEVHLRKPDYRWYDFDFQAVTDQEGNYYTNLYDDTVYRIEVRCPHPKFTYLTRTFSLDATKGGTIFKTFVIKDWDKQTNSSIQKMPA